MSTAALSARVPRPAGAARARRVALGVLGVLSVVLAWAGLVAAGALDPLIVPTPWEVASTLREDRADVARAAGETLQAGALAMAWALVGGICLGLLTGGSRFIAAFLSGLTRFLRPLPAVALAPIAILLLGLGKGTVAVLGGYAAFWPIFLGAFYGVRNLDPVLLDTGRTLGLGRAARVTRLVFPAALPSILSGVRVAVAVCLVVCVSAEVLIGTRGLGGYVMRAQYSADHGAVYAGIVVGGLLGGAVSVGFSLFQRRVAGWSMRELRMTGSVATGGDLSVAGTSTSAAGHPSTVVFPGSGGRRRTPLWALPWGRTVLAWAGVACALGVWQVAAQRMDLAVFPAFSEVARRLAELSAQGLLGEVLVPTGQRWAIAFATSALLGLAAGVVLARVRVLRELSLPVVDFARAVPATLLIPAAVALLGFGSAMVVVVVVASATWPVLISTIDGVSRVHPLTIDAARISRVRGLRLLGLTLRAAVPELLAGLRIGLSVSLAVLVVAEMIGATSGLGFFIRTSQQSFRIIDSYAGVLLLALVGWVLDSLFLQVERRLMAHSYRPAEAR